MMYGKQGMGTYAGPDETCDGVSHGQSELKAIAERIHQASHRISGVTTTLRDHADRVHGSTPAADVGNNAMPCRAGQLGAIMDALDRLYFNLSDIAEQAERNCNLA